MKKRLILLIIVVVVLAVAGVGGWVYYDLRKPVTHAKTGQYIDIPKGLFPVSHPSETDDEGVLKHEWPLSLLEGHRRREHVESRRIRLSLPNFPTRRFSQTSGRSATPESTHDPRRLDSLGHRPGDDAGAAVWLDD